MLVFRQSDQRSRTERTELGPKAGGGLADGKGGTRRASDAGVLGTIG